MVFTLIAANAILGSNWHKNLTVSGGGMSLLSRKVTYACWHDQKSGYFALKTWDCDGGHRYITITKDRGLLILSGFDLTSFGRPNLNSSEKRAPTEHPFEPETLHGISIGMSEKQVLSRLGKPNKHSHEGKSPRYDTLRYEQTIMQNKTDGQKLLNEYVFKNGKLIQIVLNLEGIPGC